MKICKKFIIGLVIASSVLVPSQVMAQDDEGLLNDGSIEVLENFQDETGFRSFGGGTVDGSEKAPGLDNLTGIIVTIVNVLKYAVGAVAVLFLMVSLIRLISGGDKSEEEMEKLKKYVMYIITAVIVIFSFDFFVNNVFDISGNNFLESENDARRFALAGAGEISGIYRFISALAATIAVTSLIVSGFRLVAASSNEESTTKARKHILYAVVGLIVIAVSEVFVQSVIFAENGTTIDVERGKALIVSLTNFAAGFAATLALISIFYAGYLYVFSATGADNAEKVKKIIIGAVIGLIIAAGAFAIVNTTIRLDSSNTSEFIENQVDNFNN